MLFKTTTRLRAFAALSLTAALCVSAQVSNPPYSNPTGDEFPILAWYSVLGDDNITPERYHELREAGVNLSFSHFQHNDEIDKALAACDGTGVKLILTSYELVDSTEATIARYKGNPNVAGYFLRDEPTTSAFASLRRFRDRVYNADRDHLVYLNLLPSIVEPAGLEAESYDDYVERFIKEVDIPLVSYDFYPIVNVDDSIFIRDTFFENLEIASRVSQANGRPFWSFCLATQHDPYPMPTAVHLRHEAFSALAYGAQAIEYFTYWTPDSKTWNFRNDPIDKCGRRTAVWYLMRDVNREIHNLTDVFLGAKLEDASHTGAVIPKGTKRLTALPERFTKLEADGEGVLVSQLSNGDKKYVMIVNRDIDHSQSVALGFDGAIHRVLPDGSLGAAPEKFTIAPGDYLLLALR